MSVTATIAVVEDRGLIQRSRVDPQRVMRWVGTGTGDGTGGFLRGNCLVPAGNAALFVSISAISSIIDQNFSVSITDGANPMFVNGYSGFNSQTSSFMQGFMPPCILYDYDGLMARIEIDNPNVTETLSVFTVAYLWDMQTARNLPFKLLWPATLG